MFRVLKAASAAVRRAALVINQQRSVTGQNAQRPSPAPKDTPPRVLISHGIDSPRMKYNVLERIVGELTGPKPILYLTHSLIDTEMAQELVADLIANKPTSQATQVDVQTIEDFMSSVLISLLKTEEAKLLDSTDEALLLFKNFSSIVGDDSTFRPDEVHKLVEFFRKLEYFNVSPQQYAEFLMQKLEGGVPDSAVRNIKMQQTLAVIYNRFVNLKNSKKVLNAYTFSLKLRSLPLSDAMKSELAKLHFNKYSHLVVNEPTLNVLKAMERLQVLSKPSAAQLTAILNVVDFDTRVLSRRDMSPHVNVIQTQLQYRAASLGIKQAASAMIQMLNINQGDNANTSFVDYEYRTPMGKKNGNVFYFNTTSNAEEIDSIGQLIQSLQNRYVNQFKLGYGDIRVVMSKDQISQVAQQLNVKHKVPVVIENVLNEPEIRATLLFLQLIIDISYLELFSNKPRKMSEVSESEAKASEDVRSFNINRSLYELMTRYYGFDPEGEIKTIFLATSLYKSDFFRMYPKLASGQNAKFSISQETFQKCNELKLSLNHYVNMFRSRVVKPSELITEFVQKTIVPLKTATEQQKNNYRRLVEVVNRFESQVPSVDDTLSEMTGESKTAHVLKEAVGQEQGPIEIANRKHLVMLLSFLEDLHVDQLPISYLTSGVRLSTFDTISTTPTHTTIIIGSRLKYLRTQLNVPASFMFERPRNISVKKQQIGQMFYNSLRQTFHNLYVTNVPDVMEEGEVEHLQGILDNLKATELNSLGLQSHLAGITSLLPPDVTKPEKIDTPGTPSQWTTPFEVTMPHTLDRISFTSIVSYIHCPLQYCYRFVLKMRPTRYFDYQSAGQFLHEKIADYNEIRKDEEEKKQVDKKGPAEKSVEPEEVKKQEAEVKATIEREKKYAEGMHGAPEQQKTSEQKPIEKKEEQKEETKEKETKEAKEKKPVEKEVKEKETKEQKEAKEKESKEKKEKEVKEKKPVEKKETEKEAKEKVVKEKEKPTEKKEEKQTKEPSKETKEIKEKEMKEKEVKKEAEKEVKEKEKMTLDTEEVAQMANEAIKDKINRAKDQPVVVQPKQEVITKTAATFVNFQKRESEKGKVADKMEQAFVIKLSEKVELTGTWDRIDHTEKGVIITEYKTSTRTKRQHTMLQLMIYGWAYEQVYGVRPLKVVLESIETGEKFDYVPNYDDNVKLQALFFQFANTLATNTFQATPSEVKCSGCVYSNICPSSLSNV